MKRIIIYRVVAVAVLLMVSSVARSEVTGIKDTSECAALVQNRTELFDALNNLSPTSQQASKFFQADRSRFVFCIDPDTQKMKYTVIQQQATLANATAYPVVIYGLTLDSSLANPGQSLLTTTAGTGEIAFQNLTATGLRAPILLQGRTTVLNGSVSCDAANTAPAIEVSSDKNTFRKVTISDCDKGMEVSGNSNALYEVAIQKTAAAAEQVGAWGVTVAGKLNAFVQLITSGYEQGVKIDASYNRITSSTLGGSIAAVQIARGVLGIKLSQNTFTTVNTIAYADLEDAKARTLLSVEWMGKHVSESDPTVADRIIGKLLDQVNPTTKIEFEGQGEKDSVSYHLQYVEECAVSLAAANIPIVFKQSDGSYQTKTILQGEKYFDCQKFADGKAGLMIPLKNNARFISNTPTVSMMSEDVAIADLGDITVFIAGASTIAPEGGGLMIAGGDAGSGLNGISTEPSAPRNDEGGGGDVRIPETTPMIGEAEAESGGGSAMSSGAMVLSGEAMPSAMGASAGCGAQMVAGVPAAPGAILLWMAPMVVLWAKRNKLKLTERSK